MLKAGRPKKVIPYPTYRNYKYILYDVVDKKTHRMARVLAVSEDAARSKTDFGKSKVKPTRIKALTDQLGHSKTNRYLKNFGPQWICNKGIIFFGTHKARRGTVRKVYRKAF